MNDKTETPMSMNKKITLGWIECFRSEAPERILAKCVTTGRMRLTNGNREYLRDVLRSAFSELRAKVANDWSDDDR